MTTIEEFSSLVKCRYSKEFCECGGLDNFLEGAVGRAFAGEFYDHIDIRCNFCGIDFEAWVPVCMPDDEIVDVRGSCPDCGEELCQ